MVMYYSLYLKYIEIHKNIKYKQLIYRFETKIVYALMEFLRTRIFHYIIIALYLN